MYKIQDECFTLIVPKSKKKSKYFCPIDEKYNTVQNKTSGNDRIFDNPPFMYNKYF